MKNLVSILKSIILSFVGLFLINMAIMYFCFDVNVMNPVYRSSITVQKYDVPSSDIVQKEVYITDSNNIDTETSEVDEGVQVEQYEENTGATQGPVTGNADVVNTAAYFMTSQEVGLLANLSLSEKLSALSIISKVNQEDANKIYELASNGITVEELIDIKAILEKYLSSQEIYDLYTLLKMN